MSDHLEEDARLLHERGWVALRGGLPHWELLSFVERCQAQWNATIIAEMEGLRDRWHEERAGSIHGGERPGTVAAELATQAMRARGARGIFISAVHPSVSESTWEWSGPRFYVSVIKCAAATMREGGAGHGDINGRAVRPPARLADLMWPDSARDGRAPWATELGWTLVPPGSAPQQMHADIVADDQYDPYPRQRGVGRFHHIAWKPCGARPVTTHVVSGAFTDGAIATEHYSLLKQVHAQRPRAANERDAAAATDAADAIASAVIIDSEMLHCGGRTPPRADGAWSATCTAQICSTRGWPALWSSGRVCVELMAMCLPIAHRVPASRNGSDHSEHTPGAKSKREREGGLAGQSATCDAVQVHPQSKKRRLATDTQRAVRLEDASVALKGDTRGTAALPIIVHPPLPGTLIRQAVLAAMRRAKSRSLSWSAHELEPLPADANARLRNSGWLEFSAGLPRVFAWEVFSFVEAWHEVAAGIVEDALDCAGGGAGASVALASRGSRVGEYAAKRATAALRRLGLPISVYSPPPSQAQDGDYDFTGPRYYISITDAAFEHFASDCDAPAGKNARVSVGVNAQAPPLPAALSHTLWPSGEQSETMGSAAEAGVRIRGLGWALAPAPERGRGDAQALHADIWGGDAPAHHLRLPRARGGQPIRFPHLLWKRGFGAPCTTEVVPAAAGGFSRGEVVDGHYDKLVQVRAPAVLLNSEMLHRGGALAPGAGWVSSCSVELCSAAGWEAWHRGTEGTEADPTDKAYRMLPIAQ